MATDILFPAEAQLRVHRFFRDNEFCEAKAFTERIPDFINECGGEWLSEVLA